MTGPLSLAAPLSPNERFAELERQVADLQRTVIEQTTRIVALEASRGAATAPLAKHNAVRMAKAERLRAAIGQVLVAQPRLTRKQVLQALERSGVIMESMPTLSTIGWHMREVRRAKSVNVNTPALTSRQ